MNIQQPVSVSTRYAVLLVDVENILRYIDNNGVAQRRKIEDINWKKLVELMIDSVDAPIVVFLGSAYLFAADGRKKTRDWILKGFRRALTDYKDHVLTFVDTQRNMPAVIVNDMWVALYRTMQNHWSPTDSNTHEITFLLAAGNGNYAAPIHDMRQLFGRDTGMKIRLHTFSWESNLSAELTRESDRMSYLDDSILRTLHEMAHR